MYPLSREQLVDGYRTMVKIRRVEETLMEIFASGEIPGFIHVCIGQEAAPVAVCAHLRETDTLAATHRGHGHALAKGLPLGLFMAELFGKKAGPCLGRSGSMHLAYRPLGLLGANGIVGGGIPIATGAAFAARYLKTDQVSVCCFGEGATDEGTFHESLNIASLKRLPVVYLCENNGWAEFTPQDIHMPVRDVAEKAAAYAMPGVVVPNDFLRIHEAAGEAIDRARRGDGPTLLEVKSRRWHGHFVGDAQKYRPREDMEEARTMDCLARFEDHLLTEGLLEREDVARIADEVRASIAEAVTHARELPFPEAADLMEGLYV